MMFHNINKFGTFKIYTFMKLQHRQKKEERGKANLKELHEAKNKHF